MFDTLDLRADQVLGAALGEDPPRKLADIVDGAWTDFAARGDPGRPRYALDRRPVRRRDTGPAVPADPYPRERRPWAGVC